MNCYTHPEREAQWTCTACGKPVCPECKVALQGKVYCNPCAEKMYVAALNRPNWFERHLNWTMAIGLFVLVIFLLIGSFILFMIEPDATEETLATQTQVIYYALSFFVLFPVAGWVIRKKGRSPWNILWLVPPLGFIVIFLLSNMSKAPQNSPEKPRIP